MTPDTFSAIVEVVYARTGIVLDESKRYLIETRLHPQARELGVGDLDALVASMRPGSEVEKRVVESLTTNETSFFRDLALFQGLEQEVLPSLIERRRATRRLRIWSAACSTGQEAYSVLLLLASKFPELDDWDVRVVGTDVNETVLAQATRGLYSQLEVNRGLPAPMLVKYFERQGRDWQIRPELRRRLEARPLNLTAPWPMLGSFDLVFVRNVLIYFDEDARVGILHRLRKAVATDGWLFLGGAETVRGADTSWERQPVGKAFGYAPRRV
ncbi:MAG: protein-glutamate O-methyltransferase CheR [Sandaracinus sp.]|nr:protein-glutamate O-methyltransferase CheR [Sandaracinus sp.]MCB9632499.1 protein-glutamate O-methyltransferase CheR [Sandaracinus sp.]